MCRPISTQTLKFWIETVGAGPFFALDHVKLDDVKYFGAPVEVDFSMVIGYWGDLQIELIRQHNDAPSIYKVLARPGARRPASCLHPGRRHGPCPRGVRQAGATVAQEGIVPNGGEVIYVDTGGGPGTMVEILKPGPGSREFFAMMREAARGWDGSDPVRRLG